MNGRLSSHIVFRIDTCESFNPNIEITESMKKVSLAEFEASMPEGTKGVEFRPLLAQNVNPPNFYLRVFDISPGGFTPRHTHDWEHEIFVVKGTGKISLSDRDETISEGDAIYVEPNELHQFLNDGTTLMRMICVVPKQKST